MNFNINFLYEFISFHEFPSFTEVMASPATFVSFSKPRMSSRRHFSMGSEAFPKDFPMFFPDLSKIYEGNHQKSDQISDRMLDFAELFGTVVLDHLDRGTVFDVFIGALIP